MPVVSPEPYRCPAITPQVLEEYAVLARDDVAPALRAWIRETDKACRANNVLIGDN